MLVELNRLLAKLAEKLVRDAQEDAELKSELRALAACLLEVTKGGAPIRGSFRDAEEAPRAREFSREDDSSALSRTTLSRGGASPITDSDLPMIETRCRLKRESLLWAIDRQELLAKRADYQTEVSPVDRELIRRAKELPDCYLWMLSAQWRPPESSRQLEDLAECFENMAAASSLARRLLADEGRERIVFEQALDLLAEAQSAVRMGVSQVNDYWDFDQNAVFRWLRGVAAREHILIKRHMRLDDPADPSRWADLQSRIGALESETLNREERTAERIKMLNTLRDNIDQIKNLDDEEEGDELWREVAENVESLLKLGVAPGSRDLYELLESVIESAPIIEDHPGFERVLEDVERRMDAGGFKSEPEPVQSDDEDDDDGDSDDDDSDDDLDEELSSDDDADDEEEEAPSRSRTTRRSASTAAASTTTRRRAAVVEEEPEEEEDEEFAEDEPDVLEVRKLLKGRNVLFVGGDKREDVAEELKSGFSLKSLTWVALKDDESLDILEEKIEDINPAIVLVGTRGVGSQIKSIQRLCTNADKPMVKLSSYSAQRVATQILAQASDQLD
jgi:hypothetical protein